MKGKLRLKVVDLDGSLRAPAGRRVHRQKLRSSQNLPGLLHGRNHSLPSGVGDSPSLLPFLDGLVMLTNLNSHLRDGIPAGENLFNGLHGSLLARDGLSRKGGTTLPVTELPAKPKIAGMGRGVTPSVFKKNFGLRLKSARVSAGYQEAEDFASALGVTPNTYRTWERGRTNVPHYLLPAICELLGKDANYFYTGIAALQKKAS